MTDRRAPGGVGRLRWAWVAALALAMPMAAGETLLEMLKRKADEHRNAAPPASPAAAEVILGRDPASLQRIFARGTVSGTELAVELTAIRARKWARNREPQANELIGITEAEAAAPAPAPGALPELDLKFLGRLAQDKALRRLESSLPSQFVLSAKSLQDYLRFLIDDPRGIAGESLKLAVPDKLTVPQMQRALTMAAMIVAARATGRVLRQASEDFASVEGEYRQLIDRREKAAALLFELLARGAAANTELRELFSPADLAYLRGEVARMSLAQFANDLGAQNLALRYLASKDPAAFADYRAQRDGVLASTRGYLKLAAGGVAFSALTAIFSRQVLIVARGRKGGEALAALPLALMFLDEAAKVLPLAAAAGTQGVTLPFKSALRFRVVEGDQSTDVAGAGDVFKGIQGREADELLQESLFRNASLGLLHKLYLCDKVEAGRLLDTAASADDRVAFAQATLAPDARELSFASLFEQPGSAREEELGDELLRSDQRPRVQTETAAVRDLQRAVTAGRSRWGDEQLMRLIFANREGAAAQATLELGPTRVQPIPSATSVFVYESLVDNCRVLVDPAPAARPAPKKRGEADAKSKTAK